MSTIQIPLTLIGTIPAPQAPAATPNPDACPVIPANAISSGVLDNYTAQPWKFEHDAATPGTTANATTAYIDPVQGRNFHFDYTQQAGERFSLVCANDPNSLNFCYDVEVRFTDPSQILNMELDVNQVLADGRTVIYDCQCASKSASWEYNAWRPSRVPGNPQQWGTGWNRTRIFWHRSADGNVVTWDGVEFNGAWESINQSSTTQTKALGWGLVIVLNFQIEGALASGTVDAFARNLRIIRW